MAFRLFSYLLYAATFLWQTGTGIHLVAFNGTVRLQAAEFPTSTTTYTNTGWMRGLNVGEAPPYAYGARGADACPVLNEREYESIKDVATCIAASEYLGVEYDPKEEENVPGAVCSGKACARNGVCYSSRLRLWHSEMSQWICSLIITTTGSSLTTVTTATLTTATLTSTTSTTVITTTTTTETTLDEDVLLVEDGTTVMNAAYWANQCKGIPENALWIKVVMGNTVDYFKPEEGKTYCEMLVDIDLHQWNPRAEDPNYAWITPYYLLNSAKGPLGGAIGSWVPDGRLFLSFWGSADEPGSPGARPGGCCALDYPNGVDPYSTGEITEIDAAGNVINNKGDVIKSANWTVDAGNVSIKGGPQNWGLPFTMYFHKPYTTTTTTSTDSYTTTITTTSFTETSLTELDWSSSTTTSFTTSFHTTTLSSTSTASTDTNPTITSTASTHTIKTIATTSTLTSSTPTTVTATTSTRSRFTITTTTITTTTPTSSTTSTTSSTMTTKTIMTETSATSTTGTTTTLTSTTFTKTRRTRTTKTTTTRTTTTKTTSTESLFPKPTTTTTPTTVTSSTLTTPTTTTPSTTTTTSGPCVCGPHGAAVYALSHGQARTCTDFEYTGFSYHGAPASCEAMAKYCNHKDMAEDVRIACPVTCCARAYQQSLAAGQGNATAAQPE